MEKRLQVDFEKIWTVKLSQDVNGYLSDSIVYVIDCFGEKGINFIKLEDSKTLKMHLPTGGYKAGETYYISPSYKTDIKMTSLLEQAFIT